jgi:predicted Zn-dependent peptidase
MSEDLKKTGLAAEVSADFLTQKDPGLISLTAAAEKDKVEQLKALILGKISQVRKNGIPEANLALAKRSLLGQFAFQNETVGGEANSYGFYFAVSEPGFADEYISCVQSVTNEEVIEAAKKYLDPEHAVILTIGPREETAE